MRPPNATFDIYINGVLATSGAAGHIRPHFALGGEMSEGHTAFRWTHILDVALGTDIRDQWPAAPTGVYFILLPTDSELDEGECAERYNVVEIERIRDQRGAEFKRVYLNRECQGVAIRVKEVDGSPDYAGICEIQFDQADGFVLSQPSAGKVRVDLSGVAAGITAEEVDGSPSYASVTTLQFDQADGFVLSQPAAGKAKVKLTPPGITAEEVDGSPSYSGVTTLQFDQADGFVLSQPAAGKTKVKLTAAGITVEDDDSTPSYSGVTILQFDQDDGFSLSQPAAGKAKVDYTLTSSGLPTDNPGASFTPKGVPYWIKVTFSHTDFQTAGTSKSVTVWTVPAKGFVHAVVPHVSTTFAGTGFFSYNLTPYYDTSAIGSAVDALTGNKAYENIATGNLASGSWPSGVNLGLGSMTASKDVKIQADSFGANLNASTAGVVDVYLLVSQMP